MKVLFVGVTERGAVSKIMKESLRILKNDVPVTYADTNDLEKDFGYKPSTSLRDGLRQFAEWYKQYIIK